MKINMKRNVPQEAIPYLEGRATISDEQFNKWFVTDCNPYYTRAIQKRIGIIEILKLAKENGCECYITPGDDAYDYGFIIFPDDVVMYIQNGDFWGFDFTIEYIPSRQNGSGCRCNEESITVVDWDELLHQKADGLAYARKLGARFYPSAATFKAKLWNFDKMVQI